MLDRESAPAVVIGDFYGNPTAAVIDHHEQWVAVVGYGVIVYQLRKPFDVYAYNRVSEQWWEAYRTPPDIRWIECIYQVADNTLRYVVDLKLPDVGIFELDVGSHCDIRLIPPEDGV